MKKPYSWNVVWRSDADVVVWSLAKSDVDVVLLSRSNGRYDKELL